MVLYVGLMSQVTDDWTRLKLNGWPLRAATADNIGGGAMEYVLRYS